MPKVDGCWANALDDCEGELSGEHLVSVAIFAAAKGMRNNRAGRIGRIIELRGSRHLPDGDYRLDDMKANILCRKHNNNTSPLDEEGGRFAQAIDDWREMTRIRKGNRFVMWPQKTFAVDGPRFERLMMKLAINNAFGHDLPIGGEDVPPGWPTKELVEMVYGARPIVRPAGLFVLEAVGNQKQLGKETFAPVFFDRNGRYLEGVVWSFRTLTLGVQFTEQTLPQDVFDVHPDLIGTRRMHFNALDAGHRLNTEVRLLWPDAPAT